MRALTSTEVRVVRFCLWTLLMLAACQITAHFAPRRVRFVPCVFLPLMIPMVLMPLRKTPKQQP
jgi:hypothetical protein